MDEMLKYLVFAIVAGGAIPIIISHLTRKPPRRDHETDDAGSEDDRDQS